MPTREQVLERTIAILQGQLVQVQTEVAELKATIMLHNEEASATESSEEK